MAGKDRVIEEVMRRDVEGVFAHYCENASVGVAGLLRSEEAARDLFNLGGPPDFQPQQYERLGSQAVVAAKVAGQNELIDLDVRRIPRQREGVLCGVAPGGEAVRGVLLV